MNWRIVLVFAVAFSLADCGTKSALTTPACARSDKADKEKNVASTASTPTETDSRCDKALKKQKNYSEPPNPIER
jgi:predicted small lipoprotein YifL